MGLGTCLLCAASSSVLCLPWGVLPPSLPQDGGPVLLSHSCHHGPFALQEPDYGALYEGRHPGFYVEANPMPTFKVCSHCLV